MTLSGCAADAGARPLSDQSSRTSSDRPASTAAAAGSTSSDRAANGPASVRGPWVVAVGDISCAPGSTTTRTTCRQADTAKLARSYAPVRYLLLGDNQYEDGTLAAYRHAFDTAWGGEMKKTLRPVPGNHEYNTADAAGYFAYFRRYQTGPTDQGYYAFDIRQWRVYALNTNCADVDCKVQRRWLADDLAANPRRCSILTMHHPRYSSGEHGDNTVSSQFWTAGINHHVDVVLSGHDHDYERFTAMDAAGHQTSDGMVSFVSGTGGKSLYGTDGVRDGSQIYSNDLAGVLALKLGRAQYGWRYETVDGKVRDRGVGTCRR